MPDREKVIKGMYQHCEVSMFDRCGECPYYEVADEPFRCRDALLMDALVLLKAQEAEIRQLRLAMLKERETEIQQLRLALDIAKGTCNVVKSGGGQFADMPTMQSAT